MVWLYNCLTNKVEILTRSKPDYWDLLRWHVWVCPVFVLGPKLHNDQKLLKWNRRACLGQFIWFSDEHSSLVTNVRHISTWYISPQFHLVSVDLFEIVIFQGDYYSTIEDISTDIFDINRCWYDKEEFGDARNLIYWPPPLHNVWLDERGRRDRKQDLAQ